MRASPRTPATIRLFSFLPAVLGLALIGCCDASHAANIRFLPLNEDVAGRKIGLQDSKHLTELKDLNLKKRSEAYACDINGKPPILLALDRERPNGNPAGVEIPLAADMKAPLVLILAEPDSPAGMRVIVIDDGETGFPWGCLRFVNTSDKPLMIRFDNNTMAIPESFAMINVEPGGEARNIGVQVFSKETPDTVLYSAVWEHDPNLRKLVFIVPAADPTSKELTLDTIPQDKRAKN